MTDEILKMRAAIVTDEALSSLRALGKELGVVGRNVNVGHAKREMGGLQGAFAGVTREIRNLAGPSMASFRMAGAGAAGVATGVAFAVQQMTKATAEYAAKQRDVIQMAQSLGMSTREVKAFTAAGKEAGIAATTMAQALANLSSNRYDLKRNLNADGVADQLRQMGQGDLVNEVKKSGSNAEAADLVQQRLEFLKQRDPERAKRVAELIYGSPDMINLTREAVARYFAQIKEGSAEGSKAVNEFNRALGEMSAAWDRLKNQPKEAMMPALTWGLETTKELLDLLGKVPTMLGNMPTTKGEMLPEGQTRRPSMTGPRDFRLPGFKPMSFMSFGADDGTGSVKDTLAEGVFEGLLRFSQYQSGGGSGGGVMNAAYSPGGGVTGAFPGNGQYPRVSDSPAVRGGGMTRGDRNNNPGNLKFGPFAKSMGATGADDRGFAIFPNRAAGDAAHEALIKSDKYKGLTLDQFGNKYAEGSASWKDTVGKALGIGRGDIVDNQNPALAGAIRRAEGTGGTPTVGSALSGKGGSIPNDVLRGAEDLLRKGGSSAQLQAYMSAAGYPKSGAWCGQFAASVVRSAGGTPPKNAGIASNWLNWGERVAPEDARPGDIGVRKTSRYGGPAIPGRTGGHVGIVKSGVDPETGRFGLMGGNQGAPVSSNRASQYEFRRATSSLEAATSMPQGPAVNAQGSVEIVVKNGSQIETKSSGELFQDTRVTKMRQQPTMIDRGGYSNDAGF